jgi:hypothetical protein
MLRRLFLMAGGWDEGWGGKLERLMRPLGAGEARAVFFMWPCKKWGLRVEHLGSPIILWKVV